MADLRALALEATGFGTLEVGDADKLLVGNIAPSSGDLTIGGASGSDGVIIEAGHDLDMSGDSVLTLAGTGNLNVTATGTHAITGGDLDVDVTSNFSANMTLSGGADLTGTSGSALSGFDSIEGIDSANLLDKTAAETITGQYTFQAGSGANPKLVVQAAGGEPADTILFEVQSSGGSSLFSVDTEGDVAIAGGETIAGAVVYTGDITLGDGGNTIKIGADTTPTQGDNVYINTTGTSDGQFSLTTANTTITNAGAIDTAGNISTDGNFVLNDGGSLTSTNNGDITINADGTGVVNVTDNLNASAGLDVTNAALTADSGLTLTGTGITMTGLDIGTAVNRAGTGYFDTINATNIIGSVSTCGTTCNQWEINSDAASGTAEDVGVMFPGGDGANVQNFQLFNDTSSPEMILRYKQDPTDPADMAEAGYTTVAQYAPAQITFSQNVDASSGLDVTGAALTVDANGIDSGGNIDLAGTLSFDAAGTIDTSGNNNLTINTGTQDVLVTAGTVDVQTNVTTLDVPDGTGFSIGGTALTTTSWTATAADIIFGDGTGDADPYHTHGSSGSADQVVIDGLTTTAMSQYQAGYVSANNTVSPTDCSSATGTYLTSTFAGVYDNTTGEIVNAGKVEVQFDGSLTPAPTAGDPAILSWVNSGQFRNRPPAAGSGNFWTWAGTVLDASTYGTNQRCVIIIQPNRPIQR